MIPKLIVVIGLPGSGKTYYLNSLVKNNEVDHKFDDFHKCAFNDSTKFEHSRHAKELLSLLKDGVNCAVSDIAFCHATRRNAFITGVKNIIKDIQMEYRCFDNDPEACKLNVTARNRPSLNEELRRIDEFSANFDKLDIYKMMPVWRK